MAQKMVRNIVHLLGENAVIIMLIQGLRSDNNMVFYDRSVHWSLDFIHQFDELSKCEFPLERTSCYLMFCTHKVRDLNSKLNISAF